MSGAGVDVELELVHISRRLKEAKAVESLLTAHDIDYAVDADRYRATVLFFFPTERVGAFFYVASSAAPSCRVLLRENGHQPVEVDPD